MERRDGRGARYQLRTFNPNYPLTPHFLVQVGLRCHKLHLLLTEDNNVGLYMNRPLFIVHFSLGKLHQFTLIRVGTGPAYILPSPEVDVILCDVAKLN